jgi:hypothetical protein
VPIADGEFAHDLIAFHPTFALLDALCCAFRACPQQWRNTAPPDHNNGQCRVRASAGSNSRFGRVRPLESPTGKMETAASHHFSSRDGQCCAEEVSAVRILLHKDIFLFFLRRWEPKRGLCAVLKDQPLPDIGTPGSVGKGPYRCRLRFCQPHCRLGRNDNGTNAAFLPHSHTTDR